MSESSDSRITCHLATPDRWVDIETLFGPRGACAGCWDMCLRITRARFATNGNEGNKEAFQRMVAAGEEPGLLAYVDGVPAGWCAVQPREAYPVLRRSRLLKPVDDQPAWAVTCFFIGQGFRRRGLTVRLLRAALAHAQARGARIVEGYPLDPLGAKVSDAHAWHGTVAAFHAVGFVEVARRSASRPIMRYVFEDAG